MKRQFDVGGIIVAEAEIVGSSYSITYLSTGNPEKPSERFSDILSREQQKKVSNEIHTWYVNQPQ